ncbi:oxygen-independent coproporphyrinogen III oxidase [Frigidibacter albus]|uniref:Coproporphyrinogen-III oxidase n=1 Tax=Frigidibacter albus TaxID=1465486 RepID=A0A6L8VJD7_9RHOB|nr:oxygen-independent coproporphyrinogen III oxidase [Frigidibacter albus]MZQ90488.1 oxygen-independent coproporphyrinogen III oxidase [Frigidibacter albus]NBE32392.1 oxygen-independent coproporphyrinogen III oxidase [Frigidibacter albus]
METESQLMRLGLFDARVPRYTSYPTAPHFSASVGPDQFTAWIEAIPAGSSISLYMHVPFCRRLCWFCACRTQGTQSDDPVRAYADVLLAELALLKAKLAPGVTLSRLHWGGGTPTLMPADMMTRVAGAVFDAVPMGPGAEFSVEIDPNEIDEARLDALAAAGMNRASIGVQDFDPAIQKVIGREQSYEETKRAVDMIRDRGVGSLNADILYGLPHQTPAKIAQSVQMLLSLVPDRVALYGYAHVPWMARRQQMIPSDTLPTPEERLALFETARKLFVWDGYDEIGIDHFARPTDGLAQAAKAGTLRRNFQGYTDDLAPVLVGMGASSISRFPQGFAQNASSTSEHTRAIRAGKFSTHRGHVFQGEDLLRSRMIEAVMCDFRIDAAEMIRDWNASPAQLKAMFGAAKAAFGDMVEITPAGLFIPERARPLTRMVARVFDAYDLSKSQHSSAI